MGKALDSLPVSGVEPDVPCKFFSGEGWLEEQVALPSEMSLTIFINSVEVVTILCTPAKLNCLVTGFLYSEGIISSVSDIAGMRICDEEPTADIQLLDKKYTAPVRRTLTSGCGGGISFDTQRQRIDSNLVATPQEISALMKQLHQHQHLFRQTGGLHSSALCNREQILATAEDIGRHNTLDKILGECLLRNIPTRDSILLTTGRMSSEMLLKAAKMQAAIVVSRGSPTGRAVALGRELNMTVVGYARGNRLSVFSGEKRLRVHGNEDNKNNLI